MAVFLKNYIMRLVSKFFIAFLILAYLNSCSSDDESSDIDSDSLNGKTTANFNSSITYGTMTDQDGNIYKTVTIGTQTWMAENLRTTKYNDGSAIDHVTDNEEWTDLTTGAYCNYNNTTDAVQIATYGRLYNWHAVDLNKLAPAGWHMPSAAEWTTLANYLGGSEIAGGKLKENGINHWKTYNEGATNETGFTALPGGARSHTGGFISFEERGMWWSATYDVLNFAFSRYLYNNNDDFIQASYDSSYLTSGFSVRLIKD